MKTNSTVDSQHANERAEFFGNPDLEAAVLKERASPSCCHGVARMSRNLRDCGRMSRGLTFLRCAATRQLDGLFRFPPFHTTSIYKLSKLGNGAPPPLSPPWLVQLRLELRVATTLSGQTVPGPSVVRRVASFMAAAPKVELPNRLDGWMRDPPH